MLGKLLRIFIAVRLFRWMRGRGHHMRMGRGMRGWGRGHYDPLHGSGLAGLFGRRRRSLI